MPAIGGELVGGGSGLATDEALAELGIVEIEIVVFDEDRLAILSLCSPLLKWTTGS